MSAASEAPPSSSQRMLSSSELRQRFASDFQPRRWLYWLDMLLSAAAGWGFFALSASLPSNMRL